MNRGAADVQARDHAQDLYGQRHATIVTADFRASWLAIQPFALPCGLLILGAVIGFPFSLDQAVAFERLLGLVLGSVLAVASAIWLRSLPRPDWLLIGAAVAALLAGLWVIAVSGPDVFRGTVGNALDRVFAPLFYVVTLNDPVEVANTRFIVGYNGLADLCLLAIVACLALVVEAPRRQRTIGLLVVSALALATLIGTGARGGLSGLAAAICLMGMVAWPRRYALAALFAATAAVVATAVGILDKGLEFSSTAGRLTYWGDLVRMLVEYPLTGVGLGVDTANTVALQYEINPDPERVFYAHNTFIQSYLETGPLGMLGMLLVPLIALAAALLARRQKPNALLLAGLGVVGGMEIHGLTDQVVTTNVGTGLVLLGLAAAVGGVTTESLSVLSSWTRRAAVVVGGVAILALAVLAVTPAGRAQALLNFGALQMDRAFASPDDRAEALSTAETWLVMALGQDGSQPAVLRDLAWVRAARFEDDSALQALKLAATSPRIDAFDTLQIAHVYRDLGFADEAYAWAARAYVAWGSAPEDAVMQEYAQRTLNDSRARTLADQAEAAMRGRHFAEAHSRFEQALTFEPSSAYLQDRLGASQRAIDKYGPGD